MLPLHVPLLPLLPAVAKLLLLAKPAAALLNAEFLFVIGSKLSVLAVAASLLAANRAAVAAVLLKQPAVATSFDFLSSVGNALIERVVQTNTNLPLLTARS